jgi:nitroimidazol reductase NimA-like FMN-containing flavoprotein (pyridoxamine 5'-phosphate oxidase superfamily)
MSYVMTERERETFLADIHVGVLSVARNGLGPLTVPVWYRYEPGGDVEIWMERRSRKFGAIEQTGRFSLLAQTETLPYKYVSVEGPVTSVAEVTHDEAVAITVRYLSAANALSFVDDVKGDDSILVRMRPERWLTNDQSKQ